ncbi:MAG TPA: hypothetical protein PKE69_25120 [Pyrinomonadaceae bacterium]|nr:hypothetical protein [Pyrinomonadaceae bacterium]
MTETQMMQAFQAIYGGLNSIQQSVGPTVLAQLNQLQQDMAAGMSNGSAQNFRTAFQGFWAIALSQVRNMHLLRAMQPFLRVGLGVAGCTWANIEIVGLAITGFLTSEIIIGAMLAFLVAAIVIFLIWLFFKYVLPALGNILFWTPKQNPQPMQTPQWKNLFSALNSPQFGPAYSINSGSIPSEISLEA